MFNFLITLIQQGVMSEVFLETLDLSDFGKLSQCSKTFRNLEELEKCKKNKLIQKQNEFLQIYEGKYKVIDIKDLSESLSHTEYFKQNLETIANMHDIYNKYGTECYMKKIHWLMEKSELKYNIQIGDVVMFIDGLSPFIYTQTGFIYIKNGAHHPRWTNYLEAHIDNFSLEKYAVLSSDMCFRMKIRKYEKQLKLNYNPIFNCSEITVNLKYGLTRKYKITCLKNMEEVINSKRKKFIRRDNNHPGTFILDEFVPR